MASDRPDAETSHIRIELANMHALIWHAQHLGRDLRKDRLGTLPNIAFARDDMNGAIFMDPNLS
jgi:hypothetical protein